MTHQKPLFVLALSAFATFGFGCSSAEEVHLTGSVSSSLVGPIHVEIFELAADGEGASADPILELDLEAPGAIDARPEVEGDRLIVRATQDVDGDGACSEGDAWSESTAQVLRSDDAAAEGEDTAASATVLLNLVVQPCP